MSNVLGTGFALLFAVAWVVFDAVVDLAWEHVERGFRSITHVVSAREQVSSSECIIFESISSRHRHVIERFVSIIEREVEWFERSSSLRPSLTLVMDHPQLFMLGGSVFLLFFCWCSIQLHYSRVPRNVSTRKPNPRPVLQRGGGALS